MGQRHENDGARTLHMHRLHTRRDYAQSSRLAKGGRACARVAPRRDRPRRATDQVPKYNIARCPPTARPGARRENCQFCLETPPPSQSAGMQLRRRYNTMAAAAEGESGAAAVSAPACRESTMELGPLPDKTAPIAASA